MLDICVDLVHVPEQRPTRSQLDASEPRHVQQLQNPQSLHSSQLPCVRLLLSLKGDQSVRCRRLNMFCMGCDRQH